MNERASAVARPTDRMVAISMHNLRALYGLLAITGWTLALLPVQLVCLALRLKLASRLPQFYHRGNCAILGIKVVIVASA